MLIKRWGAVSPDGKLRRVIFFTRDEGLKYMSVSAIKHQIVKLEIKLLPTKRRKKAREALK